MKKIIGILLLLVVMASIAGCSKEPTPEERFSDYIALWNKQKFTKMYDYLSNDAKQTITKDEFTTRYQKIYEDLQITGLKIDFKKPKEDKDAKEKVTYSFSAKMNSIAGPIHFSQKAKLQEEKRDDKKNWYLDWNTGFIFPELKEGDTIGLSTVAPKRGEIVDRDGDGMAVNGQVYEVGVVAGKEDPAVLESLSALLGMPKEQITKALGANWVKPGLFVPLKKVSMDDQERIAQLVALEPVQTRKVEARVYPFGAAAAQLVGYVGSITADELEKRKDKGYTDKDVIGKRGLEQVLDEQLKGTSGVKIVMKKKSGDAVLAEKPVVDGKNVKLTIDADVQEAVFAEMTGASAEGAAGTSGEAGTAAVMNPVTGETLALVSSPSFDPNQAVLGFSAEEWKGLQDDPRKPLTTRFKQAYAPGSVMKPLTAAVGLAGGSIKPEEGVPILGKQWQKDKSWGGYFVTRVHAGTDPVNLEKALVYSDNIYFAQAALKIGKQGFTDGLKKFGFEEDLGYPFPLEKSVIGGLDNEIALADSGYGQGQVQMSVVHLLASYTPFVSGNDGNMIKPILLADEAQGQVLKEAAVSAEHAGLIAADLRKVVGDAAGTAHAAEMADYPLAGKTGTAEMKLKQGETGTENGWFIAYNPDDPRLMVAMMVEGVQGRGGSGIPVKMVKNVFMKIK
ncbi:penicillin-binding transpeptidase domain-containing protein [Neobacillus sp. MM2021_6]|uniref:penicillin-binding transpeptidase domain-containing protein n=1 Tax=Bacillaceae TaxID=186817 RepID=UPI00140B6640|nr:MULTISPECIES: penicillin-binding transpeptidase domain-containing protein [Bacillaceae]MBO0960988.1 penicillin-binding transpeptidase domain-containing protein [Neobacillus sp. MM2021_6]NHC19100.1 penicillin-binding transpeptidase domain-containing protein [Bacillus sp. MM2020_4]